MLRLENMSSNMTDISPGEIRPWDLFSQSFWLQRENCWADTVYKNQKQREHVSKRQRDIKQTVCVNVLYEISAWQHEPVDRPLCGVGIGNVTLFLLPRDIVKRKDSRNEAWWPNILHCYVRTHTCSLSHIYTHWWCPSTYCCNWDDITEDAKDTNPISLDPF